MQKDRELIIIEYDFTIKRSRQSVIKHGACMAGRNVVFVDSPCVNHYFLCEWCTALMKRVRSRCPEDYGGYSAFID